MTAASPSGEGTTKSSTTVNLIQAVPLSSEDAAARRSDLARRYRTDHDELEGPETSAADETPDNFSIPEEIRKEYQSQRPSSPQAPPESALPPQPSSHAAKSKSGGDYFGLLGSVLEAAFVDPAYPWPPMEGQGKNAIELQASVQLLDAASESASVTSNHNTSGKHAEEPGDAGDTSVRSTQSESHTELGASFTTPRRRIVQETAVVTTSRGFGWFKCCKKSSVIETIFSEEEQDELALAKEKAQTSTNTSDIPDKGDKLENSDNSQRSNRFRATTSKRQSKQKQVQDQHELEERRKQLRNKEKEYRDKNKYSRVPEGILVYRLDTSTGILKLMSPPHSQTDPNVTIVGEFQVVEARPSTDKSRRGIEIVGADGRVVTLIACEQRTATAWLEAMNIMLAKQQGKQPRSSTSLFKSQSSSGWTNEKLKDNELNSIENAYMNLANFSHKLIRAGALPGTKRGAGGAGGIYYSVEPIKILDAEGGIASPQEDEALELIAKRRAVIKDSWDFYRMICSLLRDRAKYEEVFRKLQHDPVYPYLNSMTGLNDPGDVGYENLDKQVIQRDLPAFRNMTKFQVANELVLQAEKALPSLVEICKALAGSLGMEEVGVGPIKEPDAAMRKAEKKYGGDILKVTDFCRALLVVRDIPSLLALLELARDTFGPLISRVKMSSLKQDHPPKAGGYRDCIINVELKGHVCEIQIHLWPMWVVCGVDGFRHYRHCVEYNTDSFDDPYDALDGLDRKTIAELIVVAEEAVAEIPLDGLEWYHEKYILDYFAEAGLFMKHQLFVWAEVTFRHLIRLRTESPDIGPDHHTTVLLYHYLSQCLKAQGKSEEVKEVQERLLKAKKTNQEEQTAALSLLWSSLGEVFDMVVDPSRKEREAEEKLRKEVKLSKKKWRAIRKERFPFLDVDVHADHENSGNNGNMTSNTSRRKNSTS